VIKLFQDGGERGFEAFRHDGDPYALTCRELLFSFGLRLYLHFFNSYSDVYGSLGAVIILLTWFYLRRVAVDSEHY
jgi:hypothetical protein